MRTHLACVAGFLALSLIPIDAAAGPITLVRSIVNPSPDDGDLFGMAVSLWGGKALVGATTDGTTGAGSGRAYLIDAASGTVLKVLENPTPAVNDNFGLTVALSGNLALVGAQGDDTQLANAGAAYLFDATTGALLRTFLNPTPALNDNFGNAVALSGNLAVISAPGDDTGAANAGAAYLFDATTGVLLRTFLNPTPAVNDNFGTGVAILGNRVLISAMSDDTGASNAGSAYLFDATTGVLLQTINNPTPAINDSFGYQLALSGTKALIGALQDDTQGFNEGAAYLYDLATGNLLRTLLIPNPVGDSEFLGQGLGLSDDWALVGAGFRNKGLPTAQQDLGSAFLFDVNTGALLQEITDLQPTSNDRFGFALALDGQTALIGAQTDLVGTIRPGQVFYYTAPTPVPEPDSLGLLSCGLLGLAAVCRRVRRRQRTT